MPKNIKTLDILNEQVNSDHNKVEELISALPEVSNAISKINIEIQRDADMISEMKFKFKEGRMDIIQLSKFYPRIPWISDIDTEDTWMLNLKFNEEDIVAEFLYPIHDEQVIIYKAEAFKDWVDLNNYKIYTGPEFIMVNTTCNCAKFITAPSKARIIDECQTTNQTVRFDDPSYWRTVSLNSNNILEETYPKIIDTDSYQLVQCYPHKINAANMSLDCGKEPFIVSWNVGYKINGYTHVVERQELSPEQDAGKNFGLNFTYSNNEDPWKAKFEESIMNIRGMESNNKAMQELQSQIKIIEFVENHQMEVGSGVAAIVVLLFALLAWLVTRKKRTTNIIEAVQTQMLSNMVDKSRCQSAPNLTTPNISISIENLYQQPDITDKKPKSVHFEENGTFYPRISELTLDEPYYAVPRTRPTYVNAASNTELSLVDPNENYSYWSTGALTNSSNESIADGLRNTYSKPERFPVRKSLSILSLPAIEES